MQHVDNDGPPREETCGHRVGRHLAAIWEGEASAVSISRDSPSRPSD